MSLVTGTVSPRRWLEVKSRAEQGDAVLAVRTSPVKRPLRTPGSVVSTKTAKR
jgi:hypothetical protein